MHTAKTGWSPVFRSCGEVQQSEGSDKANYFSDRAVQGQLKSRLRRETIVANGPVCHATDQMRLPQRLSSNRQYGAVFVQAKVARIDAEGGTCSGVILDDGTRVEADVVVNCAGRWANEVVPDASAQIPLSPTAGIVAYTMPAGIGLRRGLRTPSVNLRPDGAGRLLLRSGDIDKQIDPKATLDASKPLADELLRRARALIPALSTVPLETYRIAIRPQPSDGYSVIGPATGIAGLYHCVTHSGVTLAPFIAEAVTDELVNGLERRELAGFRADRFQLAGAK